MTAEERNARAIKYLQSCGMLRVEPSKYRLMEILTGADEKLGTVNSDDA